MSSWTFSIKFYNCHDFKVKKYFLTHGLILNCIFSLIFTSDYCNKIGYDCYVILAFNYNRNMYVKGKQDNSALKAMHCSSDWHLLFSLSISNR